MLYPRFRGKYSENDLMLKIMTLFPFAACVNVPFANLDTLNYHLQKEFSTTFKVWHDSLGGDVIGLTWGESYSSKV